MKRFFLTIAMLFALTSMVHAATYIICRSAAYTRTGIDDVGDIIEIFEGPNPPGGPGYALSEIITVEVLSKTDIENKLNMIKPQTDFDEISRKTYWYDSASDIWYEVKIEPKYPLNAANLTLQDKVILADEQSTSLEQFAVLNKIESNIKKYAENSQTIKSTP